jgi:FtsH-binding integral membrane protein
MKLIKITQLLLAQYLIVCMVLIFFYQGGNLFDSHNTSYIMHQNYLSDLGRTKYFSGANNPFWFVYSITLILVGLASALFFRITANKTMSNHKWTVKILGTISGIGYIGIALSPVDIWFKQHIVFGQIAYFSFFFAGLALQVLMDRKNFRQIYKWIFVLNILLFAFLALSLFGPHSSEGVWALQIKTIAQKIMVFAQLSISLVVLYRIFATNPKFYTRQ